MKPLTIFLRFLKIGIIGFGGGSALIPVIEKEIVGQNAMEEKEYIKHTVIANITPGAQPVKLGATCGYQLGGIGGALAGAYGSMLPGVLITLFIMALFSLMGEQVVALFRNASVGISVFIVLLLVDYTLKTCNQGNRVTNWTLCLLGFLLTGGKELHHIFAQVTGYAFDALPLFDLQTIDLMIITFVMILLSIAKPNKVQIGIAVLLGIGYCLFKGAMLYNTLVANLILLALGCLVGGNLFLHRKKKTVPKKTRSLDYKAVVTMGLLLLIPLILGVIVTILCPGVFVLLGNVALSTVTSFGGGAAYISVADGFFVQSGLIDAETFYTQLLPVVNALPGPVLIKVASGIGFLFGQIQGNAVLAWMVGITAALLTSGLCGVVALAVMQVYEAVEQSSFIKNLKLYILPVICGMLLSTSCAMLYEASKITTEKNIPAAPALLVMIACVATLRWIQKKFHVHDLVLLLGCAALSLFILR